MRVDNLPALSGLILRPESEAILGGVEEAVNHDAIISTRTVHRLNPVDVGAISRAAQIAEVLRDDA